MVSTLAMATCPQAEYRTARPCFPGLAGNCMCATVVVTEADTCTVLHPVMFHCQCISSIRDSCKPTCSICTYLHNLGLSMKAACCLHCRFGVTIVFGTLYIQNMKKLKPKPSTKQLEGMLLPSTHPTVHIMKKPSLSRPAVEFTSQHHERSSWSQDQLVWEGKHIAHDAVQQLKTWVEPHDCIATLSIKGVYDSQMYCIPQ